MLGATQGEQDAAYLALRMQLQRQVDMTTHWAGMGGGLKGGSGANVLPTDDPGDNQPESGLSNAGADS